MDDPNQRRDVGPASPAVHNVRERRFVTLRLKAPNRFGWMPAEDHQHALDRLNDARDPAKRQRCGNEADHFTIVGTGESPNDLDWIRRRIGIVEFRVEPVENRFQFPH